MIFRDGRWPRPYMPGRDYIFMPDDSPDIDRVIQEKAPGTIFVKERHYAEIPDESEYRGHESLTEIDGGKYGETVIALLGKRRWKANWAFSEGIEKWYDGNVNDWLPVMILRLPDKPLRWKATDIDPATQSKHEQRFWFRCDRERKEDMLLARRIMQGLSGLCSRTGFGLSRPPDYRPETEAKNYVWISERARAWSAAKSTRLLRPSGGDQDPKALRPLRLK